MINYDLPYGLFRMDTVAGTVVLSTRAGVEVLLDADGIEAPGPVRAFVRCHGSIGQRMLVSLRYFNEKRGNFFALLDGYLEKLPPARVAEIKEQEKQRRATQRAA